MHYQPVTFFKIMLYVVREEMKDYYKHIAEKILLLTTLVIAKQEYIKNYAEILCKYMMLIFI